MEPEVVLRRSGRLSSYERPLAIIFTILAVLSPLYIDRRSAEELEPDEPGLGFSALLPLLLLVVIMAIAVSCYVDQNFTRFDANWIHRVGGSSGGIIVILTVLVLVLKCKASVMNWES